MTTEEDYLKILEEIPEYTNNGSLSAHITKKGYLRMNPCGGNGGRMVHDLIWEKYNGPIPKGYQIHHIDHNPLNNHIENLQLVDTLTHKRIHEGCKLINGVWYKQCSVCGEYKPCTPDYWYYSNGWINGKLCRKCYIQKSLLNRKKRTENGWKRQWVPKTHWKNKPYVRDKNF